MNEWLDNFQMRNDGSSRPLLRPLRIGILCLYALTMLVVPSVIAWSSWREYHRTREDLEHETLSMARLLHEHATRSIVSAEQAMQNIAEDLARTDGFDQIGEWAMHEQLKEKVRLTPHIRAIIAVDQIGMLRIHGLEYPARRIDLSDRGYFIAHRDGEDKRARVGTPLVSRTDDKWLIPVTLRINHADGRFGGVLLAGVEPNYYQRFYETLKLAQGTQIYILRGNGTILLTHPLKGNELGRNLREIDPIGPGKLEQSTPVFYSTRDASGRRVYITQLGKQSDLPIVIRISTDHEYAFAKFRQETTGKAMSALALMLVVSLLFYLLLRQIRRVEESESRLYFTQFSVDESPDMILWCDHTGQIRYANRCLAETSHYRLDELLQLKFTDLMAQSQDLWESLQVQMLMLKRQPANQTLRTELQAQRRQIQQSSLRCRNAGSVPIETTLSLIEYGSDVYLCISARDITERQEAERELRQHRDHLQDLVDERTAEIRTVLDASPLAIVLSVQDHIRLANPAFASLFGHETSAVINMPASLIYGTADRYRQASLSIRNHLEAGGTYRGEMLLQRQDGSDFWALLFARAINPPNPDRGMILIIEDITAQRIAAQAIRQSERLKRSIIDTTADGFALIDAHRQLIEVNPAFCEQLGLTRDALLGRQVEAIWGDIGEHLFPRNKNDITEKHFQEIQLSAQDGQDHPFLANSGVIPDENGKIEYTFVFLTDISRQKEIERTLLESKETAEAANQAKTTFLANMSHELRTPMHAILSFSDMGIRKAGQVEPEQTMRYFERIQASGKRLLVLLNDLLDMSRLEVDKMVYDKSSHILQATVNSALAEMSSLLGAKQLKICIDQQTPALQARYDKARITQVLINLFSNAIKFSPRGTEIHITFIDDARIGDDQPAVGLAMRDCGPGIPENDLEHIFETFAQSRQAQTQGGTGLGLAISRQIIQDHQGSIRARNHPQGGAIFTVLLPRF